ncbi:ATP-binding protein [Roseivirga thermotolerans]|uniref:ATP-binding protein n=1 Tax=Roseivirga thermotolerans TaxID=1758176 RepID=UPI00273F49C9|nr:ATP-binding protein [Roseivirga thermotolerans]
MDAKTFNCGVEMSNVLQNMAAIEKEMQWFVLVLDDRFRAYFEQNEPLNIPPPDLSEDPSKYAETVRQHSFNEEERLILMLAMAPHLCPERLDLFFTKNAHFDRGFTEFGGYLGKYHGGFLPTGETAVFLIALGHLEHRIRAISYFEPCHPFIQHEMVFLQEQPEKEPKLSRPLVMSEKYIKRFTTGELHTPESYSVFPAKKISTKLEWTDLVIDKHVREDINLIKGWIEHGQYLLHELELDRKIKPGYRSLFYGPPGTGKTLTACLLGKSTGREVYKVDLSVIVSKYIGETEKNLARIFDYAEKNDWILFFDEADALFGKRTQTNSSNDRFANQEIAYLLQRIEDFPGVIILASNLKSNIDEAFSRRFQSMVYFGMPDANHRLALWTKIFDGPLQPESALDLHELATKYEISGGSAINVYRFGALRALLRQSEVILKKDVIEGIQKEFQKEGKTL